MSDILLQTLAIPGLIWVIVTTGIAGIVYGFAGFGPALIFMPIAVVFVPVEMAVAAFSICALSSLVTVVPRAWGQADRKAVGVMIATASVTLPVGLYILRVNDSSTTRWAVLALTTVTLIALVAGWRYQTRPTRTTQAAVGLATGLVGGATGLVGPIMVMFQLGGQDSATRSRANSVVFLTTTGLLTIPMMALQGMLTTQALVLGALLMGPYGASARVGQALFDPNRQTLYRWVAYLIIAAAVVLGLPIYQ